MNSVVVVYLFVAIIGIIVQHICLTNYWISIDSIKQNKSSSNTLNELVTFEHCIVLLHENKLIMSNLVLVCLHNRK